jgi:predicted transcriptional regulator
MSDITISARIPEELSEQLTTLAQALGRNRSWIIKEALRGYIASEQQFLEAVNEGLRDIEAGHVIDHQVVMDEIDELLDQYPVGKE